MMNMCAPNTAFKQPCYQFSGTIGTSGLRLANGYNKAGVNLPGHARCQGYHIAIQPRRRPNTDTSPPILGILINTGNAPAKDVAEIVAGRSFTVESGELFTQSLTATCEVAAITLCGLNGATLAAAEIAVNVTIYECWATGTDECTSDDEGGCNPLKKSNSLR